MLSLQYTETEQVDESAKTSPAAELALAEQYIVSVKLLMPKTFAKIAAHCPSVLAVAKQMEGRSILALAQAPQVAAKLH